MTTEAYDERAAALHDRAEEPLPESWRPEKPGDELVGKFVRLDKGTTSYGDCWIVVMEHLKTNALVSVWLFHTALKNQFNKAKPKAGELVLVRYEGKRKPKAGGAEYHDWKVLTEDGGTGGGFSWEEFATTDGVDAPAFVPEDGADFSSPDDDVPF